MTNKRVARIKADLIAALRPCVSDSLPDYVQAGVLGISISEWRAALAGEYDAVKLESLVLAFYDHGYRLCAKNEGKPVLYVATIRKS